MLSLKPKFHPEFIRKINSLLGSEAEDFFHSLLQQPNVSVRLNSFKHIDKMNTAYLQGENVGWCEEGKYLKERISFTLDPLFHAGTYYVQESSSMFLSEIFKQIIDTKQSLKILDLCASPGGKSTLISSEISSESLLVTNETIGNRISALLENIVKWGVPNVFITNNNAKDFFALQNFFDVILIDAPCSGEGLFRKDENSISGWSENNVKLCAARQKRILTDILHTLKKDGILIYSTCTFSEEENEGNIKFIAEKQIFETVRINLKSEWNIVETHIESNGEKFFAYHFYPHKTKGEGFFISVLKKKYSAHKTAENRKLQTTGKLSYHEIKNISSWLKNPEKFEFIHWKNKAYAILKSQLNDFIFLSAHLKIQSFGICLGKIIDGELIPAHNLAVSIAISENIQSVELNQEQAIKFLRKEEIKINTDLKGWTLAKFCGFNLGWLKVLENRINNYYQKNLRILKT